MLDKLTAAQRHAALLALAGVLSWMLTNLDILGLPDGIKAIFGPAITMLIACLTVLTRQYGVGSGESSEVGGVDQTTAIDPDSTVGADVVEDH